MAAVAVSDRQPEVVQRGQEREHHQGERAQVQRRAPERTAAAYVPPDGLRIGAAGPGRVEAPALSALSGHRREVLAPALQDALGAAHVDGGPAGDAQHGQPLRRTVLEDRGDALYVRRQAPVEQQREGIGSVHDGMQVFVSGVNTAAPRRPGGDASAAWRTPAGPQRERPAHPARVRPPERLEATGDSGQRIAAGRLPAARQCRPGGKIPEHLRGVPLRLHVELCTVDPAIYALVLELYRGPLGPWWSSSTSASMAGS